MFYFGPAGLTGYPKGGNMLWILDGDALFVTPLVAMGTHLLYKWAILVEHAPWQGFHLNSMVFSLFLFIQQSFRIAQKQRKDTAKDLFLHVRRRGMIPVLFDIAYYKAHRLDYNDLRFVVALRRIGLVRMLAGISWLFLPQQGQLALIVALLHAFWGFWLTFHLHGYDPNCR